MIFAEYASPMPGRALSWSAVAELISSRAPLFLAVSAAFAGVFVGVVLGAVVGLRERHANQQGAGQEGRNKAPEKGSIHDTSVAG